MRKRLLALMTALLVLTGGAVATAAPASAAVYYCNENSGSYPGMPIHVSAATNQCYQNRDNYRYWATWAIQTTYNYCYSSRYPGGLPSGRTTLITDGIYGPEVAAAVENIQERHGLTADGLYGPNTASRTTFYGTGDNGSYCERVGAI